MAGVVSPSAPHERSAAPVRDRGGFGRTSARALAGGLVRRPGLALLRGPRAPSHAVDLTGFGADHVPHPTAVHTARRSPAAAVPRGQGAAHGLGVREGDTSGSAPPVAQGRVGARGDQVGDGGPRVAAGDQGLADEHGVRARVGVGDQVVRAADAGLGDLDDVVGDLGGDALEGGAVDLEVLEVAGVDADDPGPGLDGALGLLLVVGLDQRRQADGLGALDEGDQRLLFEGGDDQQREVGAVRARLPQLVRGDDEVLAEDRDVDLGADGLQVGQRAAEAALLGEDGDDGRPAGLVVRGERGRVGDGGQRALGGAGALDLADDGDALAAQGGDAVLGTGARAARSLSSSRLTRACRSARSARTPSMISSSTLTRAAPFRNGDKET